jgi:thioredoxin-related protein
MSSARLTGWNPRPGQSYRRYVFLVKSEFRAVETNSELMHLTGMRRNIVPVLLLTLTSLIATTSAQGSPNHLSGQAAPYLKRAISQPVDWYPWGADAFRRAKELNRPILLDVGAVWCPWCTLMDRDTYTNAAEADYINQHFVAVKV